MEGVNREPLKVLYLPIEGVHNVWMYTTILALTIFVYFLLKGIRAIWVEAPKFGTRSVLRQMYSMNPKIGDNRPCIRDVGRFAVSAPLPSTSISDSTSTQIRRTGPLYPSQATANHGSEK